MHPDTAPPDRQAEQCRRTAVYGLEWCPTIERFGGRAVLQPDGVQDGLAPQVRRQPRREQQRPGLLHQCAVETLRDTGLLVGIVD